MELIYDIDQNCADLRNLIVLMEPLLARCGGSVKFGVSQTSLFESAEYYDSQLFRKHCAHHQSFLSQHWDQMEFIRKRRWGLKVGATVKK